LWTGDCDRQIAWQYATLATQHTCVRDLGYTVKVKDVSPLKKFIITIL